MFLPTKQLLTSQIYQCYSEHSLRERGPALACSAMKRPKSLGCSPTLIRVSQSCKYTFSLFSISDKLLIHSHLPTHIWSPPPPCAPMQHPPPHFLAESLTFVGFPFVFANHHSASVPTPPMNSVVDGL